MCVCVCQNVELVNDVQKAILQLQAECEKLHETTRCLHEDNRQKQSHIEVDKQLSTFMLLFKDIVPFMETINSHIM